MKKNLKISTSKKKNHMKLKQTCIVINQRLCEPLFLHSKPTNEAKRLGCGIKGKKQTTNLIFSIKF